MLNRGVLKLEDIKSAVSRISHFEEDVAVMTDEACAHITNDIYLLKHIGYDPLNLDEQEVMTLSPNRIQQFIEIVASGAYNEGQYLALSIKGGKDALGGVMEDMTRLITTDLYVRTPSGNKTQRVRAMFNTLKTNSEGDSNLYVQALNKKYAEASISRQRELFQQIVLPDDCLSEDEQALKNAFNGSFIPFANPQKPIQESFVLGQGAIVLATAQEQGNDQVPDSRAYPAKTAHVQVYDFIMDSSGCSTIRRYNIAFCTGLQNETNEAFHHAQRAEIAVTLNGYLDQYSGDELQEKIEELVRNFPGSALLVDENGVINKLINLGSVAPEEGYLAACFICSEEDKQALRDLQAMSTWKNSDFDLMMKMPAKNMVDVKESFLRMKRVPLFLQSTIQAFQPTKLLLGLPFLFIPNILFTIGSFLRAAAYSMAMQSTSFTSFVNFLGVVLQYPLGISHKVVTGNFGLMVVRPSNTSSDLENYRATLSQVKIATSPLVPAKMTPSSKIAKGQSIGPSARSGTKLSRVSPIPPPSSHNSLTNDSNCKGCC